MKLGIGRLSGILLTCLLLLSCAGCGGMMFLFEIPAWLCVGWVAYLSRVLPQVTVNPGSIVIGVLAMIISLVLAHATAAWFWNSTHADRPWRTRWTLRCYFLVLCTFAAAVCLVSITHQCLWIITSPRPFIHEDLPGRFYAKQSSVQSSVHSVNAQLDLYRSQHRGKYPSLDQMRDWSVLTEKTDESGTVGSTATLGPYLVSRPANPFNYSYEVVSPQAPPASAGWVYDQTTGRLRGIIPSQALEEEGLKDTPLSPEFLIVPSADSR